MNKCYKEKPKYNDYHIYSHVLINCCNDIKFDLS